MTVQKDSGFNEKVEGYYNLGGHLMELWRSEAQGRPPEMPVSKLRSRGGRSWKGEDSGPSKQLHKDSGEAGPFSQA